MSLVPSEYPEHAVEMTVTFLLAAADADSDAGEIAALDNWLHAKPTEPAIVAWWTDKAAEYAEGRQVLAFHYNRPPEFVRPRPKRAKR
jgi:hypothetical protein